MGSPQTSRTSSNSTTVAGRRLRVLYSFPHRLGEPGIGTTALHQVQGLIDRGLDVAVYCTSATQSLPGARQLVETMVFAGRRIPHKALGVHWAYRYHDRRVALALRASHSQFDVVHTWPLGAATTLAAARRHGVLGVRESPNSYTAVAYERVGREASSLGIQLPRGASHRFNPRRLRLEEREYELAGAVLVPSESVERTFAERAGEDVHTRRHRYGFDPRSFPAPSPLRNGGPFTLAFVGSGEPRKGLHYALEAWRQAGLAGTSARFIICGSLMPAYEKRLGMALTQAGVEVRPFTNDVGRLLRQTDVLILPSIEEGSALVTYEAQASGCALLVSDACGALMTDGEHGFVHSVGDVAALTAQLRRLATDDELLAELRARVLAHREELTWSAAAQALDASYRAELSS